MAKKIEHPTAEQLHRREISRRSAARARARRLAARNAQATHCQRRQGQGMCGARLETTVDRQRGVAVTRCPACARREAGVCRDCPRPVAGTRGIATRCEPCAKRARTEACARWSVRNAEEKSRRWKARYAALPAKEKQRRLHEKKLWRRAHPEKVQQYRERERETRREKILAYHREYRARNRERILEKARIDYYTRHPRPTIKPCRLCKAPIKWAPPGRPKRVCDACVPPSVRARRRSVVPDYVRPTIVKAPRTCVTKGCDIVVSHRQKKCDRCRQRHQEMAKTLLGARAA